MRRPLRVLYVTTPRYDFTTATLIQGLNAIPGIELRTTTLGNYATVSQVLSKRDAAAYGRTAALLILGYNRGVDTELFWSVQNADAVRVFVDGGDNSELPTSRKELLELDVVFKREYFLQDSSPRTWLKLVLRRHPGAWGTIRRHPLVPFPSYVGFENRTHFRDLLRNVAVLPLRHKVHPFPYGIEERFLGTVNPRPTYELSCILTCHVPERREFVDRLRSLRLPSAFIGEIPSEPEDTQRLIELGAVNPSSMRPVELGHNIRYYAQISTSRRCISIPGGGFDTLRFWEILGLGSLLISKRIAIEMPQPLIEGKHYLAFDSFNELRDVIEKSYDHREQADEIRANGHAFARQFHSAKARALYLLSTLVHRGLLSPSQLPEGVIKGDHRASSGRPGNTD